MTTPGGNDSDAVLLVALVEMAEGHADEGTRYENTVLALLGRHGGTVERRLRRIDSADEVHVIRFRSRAGYESYLADPDRVGYRSRLGDSAPTTRVLEVFDLPV